MVLWEDQRHRCIWLGAGDLAVEADMPSNQYLIVDDDDGYLLDPGGYNVFERACDNVLRLLEPEAVKGIVLSHQDPDVCGALAKWVERFPGARVIVSGLWVRFLLHLPLDEVPAVVPLPDEGDVIRLKSGDALRLIPAHYLHSAGNFHVYDERSKTLFSGDLGASIVAVQPSLPTVASFDAHVDAMEHFHRRYLPCNAVKDDYLERLRALRLDIDRICPQHGAVIEGRDVERFFDWLSDLDVGIDFSGWGQSRRAL
jgi:flavorubredoxin